MCSRAGLYLCPATDRSNITGTKLRKSDFRIHFTAVSGSKFCGVPGCRSLGRETFGASPPLIGAGNLKFLRVPLSLSLGRETQTPFHSVRVSVIASQLLLVFRSLCAVFGTGLLSVGYAGSIKSTSDDRMLKMKKNQRKLPKMPKKPAKTSRTNRNSQNKAERSTTKSESSTVRGCL